MSPTGPYYAGTAVDNGGVQGAWTNPGNATGTADGVYASGNISGGGSQTNYLKTTNFGFNLPSTAVIDGIYIEFDRIGTNAQTQSVQIVKGGSLVGTAKSGTDVWPAGTAAWTNYGSSTDLWGTTWTYSDINNSGFGVAISARNTSGGGTANIDAVRITVYWHTAPVSVPKRYIYQVYSSSGTYLGVLPNVLNDFQYAQEMNTAGAQINIEVGVSADTAAQAVDTLTDESGNVITDESSNTLTDEGQMPIVALGSSGSTALIKNGNKIKIYEYGYWNPNGKLMFSGEIENWDADFGGSGEDKITVLCYSDGSDLENYLVRGNPYTYTQDQANTSQNASVTVSGSTDKGAAATTYGQSIVAGVTNLGAITLKLNGTANVTINFYTSSSLTTLLGSVTQSVNVTSATDVQFAYPNTIATTSGTSYFFTVSVGSNQSITLYYQNTDTYGSGAMYVSTTSGNGSQGAYSLFGTSDLYFKTFSGTGSTTGTYTSQDPTTGMLEPIMNDYIARGGLITYSSSTVTATGLSLTYGFNTQTILEAIQKVKDMSPSGFYWYVDVGSDTLYFKQTSTTADITLVKGQNLESVHVKASIENVKNTTYFSGGLSGGSNIYALKSDVTSLGLYGPRLDRLSDNRVTNLTTADQIAQSNNDTYSSEQFQSKVTVLDSHYIDITTIRPGMVVGFAGFGTFVDNLLMQIVRLEYTPEAVTLQLGVLPKRLFPAFDKLIRGLIALQTVNNPTTPS